jgi:hypothetical protein
MHLDLLNGPAVIATGFEVGDSLDYGGSAAGLRSPILSLRVSRYDDALTRTQSNETLPRLASMKDLHA